MIWSNDFINKVICGDCLEVMKEIPDGAIDIIITDPVWPNCGHIFNVDPWKLFEDFCSQIDRLTNRLIVHLSAASDPRFLKYVPESFRFVSFVWLPRIPPRYIGNALIESDVAYLFGSGWPNVVIPARAEKGVNWAGPMKVSTGRTDNPHPSYRPYPHVRWLVGKCTKPDDIVLDPFAGSGTTLQACREHGRPFIGIEINPDYCKIAEDRLRQRELF